MSVLNEVLDANKKYVESFGEKGKLALPPARQFAVLTCMDARLDPAKMVINQNYCVFVKQVFPVKFRAYLPKSLGWDATQPRKAREAPSQFHKVNLELT